MTVSIIISTRNRAESLRSTLASIGAVSVPTAWEVEIVAIDNGSSDHTPEVIQTARLANVSVRYVREPKPGKAIALNTGLAQSKGEIILFTDDDVRVPNNWIERMGQKLLLGDADAVAGKVIFPDHVDRALNACVLRNFRAWFASTDEIDVNRPQRMVGANMGVHRRVLAKVPGFDIELGPGAHGFYEDSLFSWQIRDAGFNLVTAFDIAVEHHFDIDRLTDDACVAISRRMGRSRAFVFHHWRLQRSRLALPRLALCELKMAWHLSKRRLRPISSSRLTAQEISLELNRAFCQEYLQVRSVAPKYSPRRHSTSRQPSQSV